MRIPKYKQLLEEAALKEKESKELKRKAQSLCPHSEIIRESFCDDDWAYIKKYTTWYKCNICELQSSSDENDPLHIKMKKLHSDQTAKRCGYLK